MKLLPYDPLTTGSYLLSCGWRVFHKVQQMWEGLQHGGCVSMGWCEWVEGGDVENM